MDVAGRAAFGQHDAVGSAANHRGEVEKSVVRIERVDAHEEFLAASRFEGRPAKLARRRSLRRHDGILKVEDQRVGGGGLRLGDLSFAVARHEQKRADCLHAQKLPMPRKPSSGKKS